MRHANALDKLVDTRRSIAAKAIAIFASLSLLMSSFAIPAIAFAAGESADSVDPVIGNIDTGSDDTEFDKPVKEGDASSSSGVSENEASEETTTPVETTNMPSEGNAGISQVNPLQKTLFSSILADGSILDRQYLYVYMKTIGGGDKLQALKDSTNGSYDNGWYILGRLTSYDIPDANWKITENQFPTYRDEVLSSFSTFEPRVFWSGVHRKTVNTDIYTLPSDSFSLTADWMANGFNSAAWEWHLNSTVYGYMVKFIDEDGNTIADSINGAQASDIVKAESFMDKIPTGYEYAPSSVDAPFIQIRDNSYTLTIRCKKQEHNVAYSWNGLPEDVTFYDETGNAEKAAPELPATETLKYGDTVNVSTVDEQFYVKNESGNVYGYYKLGDWKNAEVDKAVPTTMGTEDINLIADWTFTRTLNPSLTVASSESTYDGNDHTVNASMTDKAATDTVEYSNDGTTWETTLPTFKDVSATPYAVQVRVVDADGKVLASGNGTATINPREITVKAKNDSKQFNTKDPEKFEYDVSYKQVLGENAAFDGNLVREAGEDVRDYTINQGTLLLKDNGDFKASNYTIKFEQGIFTIANNTTMTLTANGYAGNYDGQDHFATAETNIEGAKIEYKAAGSNEWTDQAPSIKNAGEITYDVRVTKTGYETKTGSVTMRVEAIPARIDVRSYTKNAGEVDPVFEGEVIGLLDSNDLGDVSYGRIDFGETVGTYALGATYTENDNYVVAVNNGTLTINPAPVVPPLPIPVGPAVPAAPAGPVVPAVAPAPAAADAAATTTITDDMTPLAGAGDRAQGEETIADDETPMTAFDHPTCWVHWLMAIGLVLTLIYGAIAIARREGQTRNINKMQREVLGENVRARRSSVNNHVNAHN